ncbi:Proteasome assembly chaperone 4 [Camellia lanceoleosa]|uniref:Proteasome assembly chaperone 4 n=1 Tax=Camellia lanceoleosa TaxID=1840588 RepID=A0ACC0F6K7_9ERIC|nr:Proteasome assembly chaperone 4 [Camellia lanceoleosa]
MESGGLDVESMKHSCGSAAGVEEVLVDVVVKGVGGLGIEGGATSSDGSFEVINSNNGDGDSYSGGVQVTCFTEVLEDVTLHFQITRLHKQIYAWIGCNSAIFGRLYNNTMSVTNILGGSSDNIGSGIARRLVLKTGLDVILACNIPKNTPCLRYPG